MTLTPGAALTPRSAVAVRVVPFVVFLVLTSLQGALGPASPFWVYALKTAAGAAGLVWMWRRVSELQWRFSGLGLAAGVGVAGLWIGLDPYYPKPPLAGTTWNPFEAFPQQPALAWSLVGIALIVAIAVLAMK